MNMRRLLVTPVVLSVVVAIMGLVWGSTPAFAGTTTTIIPISGTVNGQPESVSLSGNVQIKSTLVTDPDFGTPPKVILAFSFLNVSGVGLSTGKKYMSSAEDNKIRPLAASDMVEITFPFQNMTMGMSSARWGLASFTLIFDLTTGGVTQGTGTIATSNF
jgi:hypothetical protein